jgi:hypothetical protein
MPKVHTLRELVQCFSREREKEREREREREREKVLDGKILMIDRDC